MRIRGLFLLALLPLAATGQEKADIRELVGQIGSRSALLALYPMKTADGAWHVTGEYVVLSTMVRRFLEGERSPQLGVTTLKEGNTPILFGRPPTATLQGTWRDGTFRGTRYGPAGQERERFEFSEEFPSMEGYTASPRCETNDERYASTLNYSVDSGKLRAGTFEWRSRIAPRGQGCALGGLASVQQVALKGGLRFSVGPPGSQCAVTLRDLGELVRVNAENCSAFCGPDAYLEPLLLDRRGGCALFRPQSGR